MVKETALIFQIDSPDVKEAFLLDNYSVEYNDNVSSEENLCVIYFSSNEIYYPNTSAAFNHSIIQRDKYEWKRNRFPKAKKHIFLRDLHKQWYLSGINTRLDNPQKIFEFLKKETVGYRTITIGSSAGGYAAILFGSMLNCYRIYAFNAQLNLKVIMKNSNAATDPVLFEKATDPNYDKYFDLSNFIIQTTENYYFQSCKSRMDVEQYQAISKSAQNNLNIVCFKTSNHGFPFLRNNLPYVLALNSKELEGYKDKKNHPVFFSIRLIGIIPTFTFILKALKDRYKKKKLEASFKTN